MKREDEEVQCSTANKLPDAKKDQLNWLELNYYEKLDAIWRMFFSGCVGFVALVVPFVLKTEIAEPARLWIKYSVGVVIVACCFLVVPMFRYPVIIKRIREDGLKSQGQCESNQTYFNATMWVFIGLFVVSIIVALVLLSRALWC